MKIRGEAERLAAVSSIQMFLFIPISFQYSHFYLWLNWQLSCKLGNKLHSLPTRSVIIISSSVSTLAKVGCRSTWKWETRYSKYLCYEEYGEMCLCFWSGNVWVTGQREMGKGHRLSSHPIPMRTNRHT